MFIQSTFKDDVNAFLKSGAFWIALGIAILMAVVPLLMLRRYLRYKKQMKENQKIENNSKEIKEETLNNDTKAEQV